MLCFAVRRCINALASPPSLLHPQANQQTNKPTRTHSQRNSLSFLARNRFRRSKSEVRSISVTAANASGKNNSSHKFPKTQNRMMINTNMNRVQDNQDIVGGGRWTPEEHMLFIEGFKMFGKDWKRISKVVETRNNIQCRTHAQKFFRSHPQELALLLAIKKQNAQSPVVNEPLIKPAFIPYQQQSFPLQQQQHLPVLDARFVAYVKQRVNQVPGPLFMPFM